MKCPYCCFVYAYPENEFLNLSLIPDYVKSLKKEIKNYKFPKLNLESVILGGGTPSLLSKKQTKEILHAIFNNVERFNSFPKWISFEATPETATRKRLESFRELGFNRVSIGIQSFFLEELKLLGRINTEDEAYASIENAKQLGFKAINIDLIFGFPGNTFERWQQNVEIAISSNVENISTYINTTAFFGAKKYVEKLKKRGYISPSLQEKVRMFEYAIKRLNESNYNRINCFLYSKPDINFSYEKDVFRMSDNIIGFGPFSLSFWEKTIYQGFPFIKEYIKNPFNKYFSKPYKENVFKFIFSNITHNGKIERKFTEDVFGEKLEHLIRNDKLSDDLICLFQKKKYGQFDKEGFIIEDFFIPIAVVKLWDYFEHVI